MALAETTRRQLDREPRRVPSPQHKAPRPNAPAASVPNQVATLAKPVALEEGSLEALVEEGDWGIIGVLCRVANVLRIGLYRVNVMKVPQFYYCDIFIMQVG